MSAPKGNSYHQLRSKSGRQKKFPTPKALEKAWLDYFEWVDKRPWYKNEAVKSGPNAGKIIKIPTKRPYTESGFCSFHGLGKNYLAQFSKSLEGKTDKRSQDLSGVLSWAINLCYTDKVEGALVGAYNANLVARLEGLKEASSVTFTKVGKDLADETYE